MKIVLSVCFLLLTFAGYSQDSTIASSPKGVTAVKKDPRLDILAKKEADYNDALASGMRSTKGYRLMLLSTTDRAQAMSIRTQLLQRYPDQKVYTTFELPNIKLKFGNFVEREDADKMRQEITKSKLITTNIYIVPETVEVKVDKTKDNATL